MNVAGIYQIQSKVKPERIYIGTAKAISKRWECHLRDLRNNNHHSGKLQYHYNKYGEADLVFSIILGCEIVDLLKTEQYFLDSYKPYFNTYMVAGSPKGYKHSPETLKKISESQMGEKNPNYGRQFSEEHRKKLSDIAKKRKFSEETRHKISLSQKGIKKPKSEEHRHKLSLANKGKKLSIETRKKLSESLKGKNTWSKGRACTEEAKEKLRIYARNKRNGLNVNINPN